MHPSQLIALINRREEVMTRAAWPLAKFAAIYVNGHQGEDSTTLISPFFFIPGKESEGDYDSQIALEDMPFEEIEANFRSYQAYWEKTHPEERN